MEITITKISSKLNAKKQLVTTITSEKGAFFYSCLKDIDKLTAGDVIEAKVSPIIENGKKYDAITSYQLLRVNGPVNEIVNLARAEREARGLALTEAVKVSQSYRLDVNSILPLADEYAHWLIHGTEK